MLGVVWLYSWTSRDGERTPERAERRLVVLVT